MDKQIERLRAYCMARGLAVSGEYSDRHASGGRGDRPGFVQAVDHACRLRCPLVVLAIDRLARDYADAAAVLKRLRKSGASFITITEATDTSTIDGRLMFGIKALFAEAVREKIGERLSYGMLRNQAGGRRQTRRSAVPFGWALDKADPDEMRMVHYEPERRIVTLMEQLEREGLSDKQITIRINAEGHRQRNGDPWREVRVHRVLDRLRRERLLRPEEAVQAPSVPAAATNGTPEARKTPRKPAPRPPEARPSTPPAPSPSHVPQPPSLERSALTYVRQAGRAYRTTTTQWLAAQFGVTADEATSVIDQLIDRGEMAGDSLKLWPAEPTPSRFGQSPRSPT